MSFEATKILKYPLLTEKSIDKIEKENKLVFVVERKAGKKQIASAVERLFNVKVESVNTLIDRKGRKKAFVKLSREHSASELATRLGIV